jgi:hypothetical protein
MKKLHFKGQLFAAPERAIGRESDGAVTVVVEVLQVIRQLVVRRVERLAGGIPRHLSNAGSIEWHTLSVRRREKPTRR